MQKEDIDLHWWLQSIVQEEWILEVFEEELVSMLQIAMLCVSQPFQ